MTTYEPQYAWQVALRDKQGGFPMGLTSGSTYSLDPRRLCFTLSRYKFAAKMLKGKKSVLEVGCGDGFGARIIMQEVPKYIGIDIDQIFISDAQSRPHAPFAPSFTVHDILASPLPQKYDGVLSLDVLEHISPLTEIRYFQNIKESMVDDGVLICGMPSLESQKYASQDGAGHINCKSGDDFFKCCSQHFKNVFLFSMNDEVVHTGFSKMAHYLICVCASPKN
jgi:SAM-dependent methyltransferase